MDLPERPNMRSEGEGMKLRLHQQVHAIDGKFGELADIVIDPVQRTLTHVVVEPPGQQSLARLVPISLVTLLDDVVTVDLPLSVMRQLQRVSLDDFVPVGDGFVMEDGWDIGTQDVLARPYWDARTDGMSLGTLDRIPKTECEIRRGSEVTSADFQVVGHVEGFLADGDDLLAVLVTTTSLGSRRPRRVIVPMSSVAQVFNNEIVLNLTRSDFDELPQAEGFSPIGSPPIVKRNMAGAGLLARRAAHRRQRRPAS